MNEIDSILAQAAKSNSPQDHEVLYKALEGREVFFNTVVDSGGQVTSTPLLKLPNGEHAMMLYTSKENARLERPFGGGPWEKLLGAMVGMREADGLILSNSQLDSVAIDKKNGKRLLSIMNGGA